MAYEKTQSAARGGKIVTCYPKDNSSHKIDGKSNGSMGGSTTNLAHSLSGSSANVEGNKGKKNRFD